MADAKRITTLLLTHYPEPKLALEFSNPLELLLAVILSAQCTDARVNEVTKSLFKKFKSATDYARAEPSAFEQEIRSTGFYRNKAKKIISCCQKIAQEFQGEVPSTVEELTALPGVGRKTANMVLGNAFGKQAIAVDTHVFRIAHRLGLAHSKNADKVEAELSAVIPSGKQTAFTNAMILHGRATCTARSPRCSECVLYEDCEWPEKPGA